MELDIRLRELHMAGAGGSLRAGSACGRDFLDMGILHGKKI